MGILIASTCYTLPCWVSLEPTSNKKHEKCCLHTFQPKIRAFSRQTGSSSEPTRTGTHNVNVVKTHISCFDISTYMYIYLYTCTCMYLYGSRDKYVYTKLHVYMSLSWHRYSSRVGSACLWWGSSSSLTHTTALSEVCATSSLLCTRTPNGS